MKDENKKFKAINVDEQTSEFIHYIAQITNKPITTLLNEVFTALVQTGCSFKNGSNLSYTRYGNTVSFEFSGRSRLITGKIQAPEDISEQHENRLIAEEIAKTEKLNHEIFGET